MSVAPKKMQKSDKGGEKLSSSVAFQAESWDFGCSDSGWHFPSCFSSLLRLYKKPLRCNTFFKFALKLIRHSLYNIFTLLCFLILYRRWATGRSSRGCFAPFHLKATCTRLATWWRKWTPLLYQTTVCQHTHWRGGFAYCILSTA